MRFKNLTIILTLMSLSVVAFVGLTLLPITDGICEWTGDKSSKSYYLNSVHKDKKPNPNNPDAWSEDTREGRGWHLSASLSAGHNEAKALSRLLSMEKGLLPKMIDSVGPRM